MELGDDVDTDVELDTATKRRLTDSRSLQNVVDRSMFGVIGIVAGARSILRFCRHYEFTTDHTHQARREAIDADSAPV